MTDVEVRRHPAKFSPGVLDALRRRLDAESVRLGRLPRVLDTFAGTGRIHDLDGSSGFTTGVELEPEWAAQRAGTIVGDARSLPFGADSFDVVATSPCYGNRMADTYAGGGTCRRCAGTGSVEVGERGERPVSICPRCDGAGVDVSTRHTYTIALGRPLADGNAGAMQWGDAYRDLHRAAIAEWRRVLRPGGLALVNMSNHVRAKREVPVVEWWVEALGTSGFGVVALDPIETPRLGHGQNHDARVSGERLIVARLLP